MNYLITKQKTLPTYYETKATILCHTKSSELLLRIRINFLNDIIKFRAKMVYDKNIYFPIFL